MGMKEEKKEGDWNEQQKRANGLGKMINMRLFENSWMGKFVERLQFLYPFMNAYQ